MTTTYLDLATLFEKAFGYRTNAFEPQFDAGNTMPMQRKTHRSNGAPLYATDAFGREYFLPMIVSFPGVAGEGLTKWELPYPIVSVTGKKTMVETLLVERKGTAKELIAAEDFIITVKGFIVGKDHDFPEQEITTLRRLYEQNMPVSIACALTDPFLLRPNRSGSDQVVITELTLPFITGVKNIRPYELKMVSDELFDLFTIDKR